MMAPVLADVVWPSLILSGKLLTWWCIGASIVLEAVALWWFIRMHPLKATGASILMNAVSGFCGLLLIPLAGIWWEALASFTINQWMKWGTFNPVSWTATFLIVVAFNTLIETLVAWLVFCMPWTRRLLIVIFLANAVTVALACLTALL